MKAILVSLLILTAAARAATPAQEIFVASDGTFRGPFTAGTAKNGETPVTLTAAQYQQIDALRKANLGIVAPVFQWNTSAGTASLAPITQLNAQLLTIFQGLNTAEQDLFAPQFQAIAKHLAANDAQGVYTIIYLSGQGMSAGIATARAQMLTAVSQLFPSVQAPQ